MDENPEMQNKNTSKQAFWVAQCLSAGSGLFGTLLLGLTLGGYTDLSLLLGTILIATLLIF